MGTGLDYFFVKALYSLAIEQGSPSVIIALRDKAMDMIVTGNFDQLISATLNGKTITKKVYRDPSQLLAEASLALNYYNSGPEASFGFDWMGTSLS